MMTNPAATRIAEQFARAQTLQQQGQPAAARLIYQEILGAEPDHFDALNAMGVLEGQSKDLQQAIQYFERAIAVQPGNSGAHCNRGLALKQLRQPEAALACLDRAIELDPRSAIAHYSRAEVCKDLGRTDAALASYDEAIAINPGFVHAFYGRGVVLQQSARLDEAVASYDQAIRLRPDHFEAHVNKALSLFSLGRHVEAMASCDQAVALKPNHAPAYLLRGNMLRALDSRKAALSDYEQAIAIDPNDATAHCNRGAALLLLDRVDDALASFDRAIAINPDYVEAYFHRGYSLRMLNRFDSAAVAYKTVATLAPDFEFLPGTRLEADMHVCDWREFYHLVDQIVAGIESERARLASVDLHGTRWIRRACSIKVAQTWARFACPADDSLGPISPRARLARLTVGYLSADLREHPIGRLLTELIEIHDRSRFEVIAFSFGPRTRAMNCSSGLMQAFDRFIEVRENSNVEIASLARSLHVDIAVDLGGYSIRQPGRIFLPCAPPRYR